MEHLEKKEVEAIELAAKLNGGDMTDEQVIEAVEKQGGEPIDAVDRFEILHGHLPAET